MRRRLSAVLLISKFYDAELTMEQVQPIIYSAANYFVSACSGNRSVACYREA